MKYTDKSIILMYINKTFGQSISIRSVSVWKRKTYIIQVQRSEVAGEREYPINIYTTVENLQITTAIGQSACYKCRIAVNCMDFLGNIAEFSTVNFSLLRTLNFILSSILRYTTASDIILLRRLAVIQTDGVKEKT